MLSLLAEDMLLEFLNLHYLSFPLGFSNSLCNNMEGLFLHSFREEFLLSFQFTLTISLPVLPVKRSSWKFYDNVVSLNCCRFYSDGKKQNESPWGGTEPSQVERSSSTYKVPSTSLLKPDNGVIGGTNRLTESFGIGKSKVFPGDHQTWRKRILDPGSEIVLQWNRVFMVSCLVALFVDPLYFYLPTLGGTAAAPCVKTDLSLRILVTCLRTIADIFYMLHMVIKFRTAYVAPSSRVFGKGELVMDPKKIALRYIRFDFFIDLIAMLPLPQVFDCHLLFSLLLDRSHCNQFILELSFRLNMTVL